MKSVLGSVQIMHATGMTPKHIKPDNSMMTSNLDQCVFVHRLINHGKKAVAILIDFGLAAFPCVYYVQPQHFPKFISKPMEESVPEERQGLSAKSNFSKGTPRESIIAVNAQNQSGGKTVQKAQEEKAEPALLPPQAAAATAEAAAAPAVAKLRPWPWHCPAWPPCSPDCQSWLNITHP
jgi:hypothetical protein